MAISGDLEGSKFICCGADDNAGHLYTQTGWQPLHERKAEERKRGRNGAWEKGGIRGAHPGPSHTELGGKKEKKAIVADKRAIQLRTPRTLIAKNSLEIEPDPRGVKNGEIEGFL